MRWTYGGGAGPVILAISNGDAVVPALAGAVTLGLWILLAAAVILATRPRLPPPGPATDDPGPEPPAVANFLVHRCHVTGTAVSATLVDLAARRFLDIEQVAPEMFLCRLFGHRPPRGDLSDYEAEVLALVERKATTGGTVACEELSLGQGAQAQSWWKSFSASVVEDARHRGLVRRRMGPLLGAVLAGALAIPLALGGVALEVLAAVDRAQGSTADGDQFGGGFAVAFVVWMAITVFGARRLRQWRETPAGRDVAARLLGHRSYLGQVETLTEASPAAVAIWGRHLAYGTALGVCPGVAYRMPIGPQRNDEAWSAYGGLWREVRIRYSKRFAEGMAPTRAALIGFGWLALTLVVFFVVARTFLPAVWSTVPSLLADDASPWERFGVGLGASAFFSVPLVWCAVKGVRAVVILVRALPDLGQRVTLVGQVLRVPQYWDSGGDSSPGRWAPTGFTAVDDGISEEIRALRFQRDDIGEGAVVRVEMSPRLRHVYSCEVIPDATASQRWTRPARST